MKQRNPAMDIIRCFALLCVVGIHFFRNNDFNSITVVGLPMAAMIMIRNFSMVCVPLFLMLSGYLLKDRKPCKKYYSRIIYILGIYLLACLACGSYKMLFQDLSPVEAFFGIFDYETASYGWYIEMYIGLFLLIPFLNMMYHGAQTRRGRQLLLLTFLLLTTLPSIFNIWELRSLSWFLHPSASLNFDPLVPNYWVATFPITFYFLGAYLRDYPLELKPWKHLLLILTVSVAGGLFSYYRSYGRTFIGAEWVEYRSIWTTCLSILLFSFLANRQWKAVGPKTAKILAKLSSWTLGAYLCSEIFDLAFYPLLLERGYSMVIRMAFFPLMVGAVYLCSYALSALLNGIYNLLAHFFLRKKAPAEIR